MEEQDKIENEEELIATGYILKIYKIKKIEPEEEEEQEEEEESEEPEVIVETKEYILVVKGDCDGNGEADFKDILKVNKHRLGKSDLEGAYLKAGDVTGDGKADFKDILKINKFRLGKSTEL